MPHVSLHWFQQNVRYGDLLRHLVARSSLVSLAGAFFEAVSGRPLPAGESALGISSPMMYCRIREFHVNKDGL
jgi:hypothetical protein